jgi:DNA primase
MIDIIQLLDDHNIDYKLTGVNTSENFVNTKCVFCDDQSNHLGWHKTGSHTSCWKCGKHRIEDSLMNLLDISYFEAKDLIDEYSGYYNIFLDNVRNRNKQAKKIKMPGEILQDMHKNYLIKRGFDPDYIERKYRIKGTGYTGDWKYRIMIPIFYKHRLVSYQGRDVTNKQKLRYMTLSEEESGFDIETIFYGIDDCKKDVVGLVEGAFDRWKAGSDFMSCLTSNIGDEQIKLLTSMYKRVFMIFDPEKQAYKNAKEIAKKLNILGVESYVVTLDDGKDPAESSEDDIKYLRKEMGL